MFQHADVGKSPAGPVVVVVVVVPVSLALALQSPSAAARRRHAAAGAGADRAAVLEHADLQLRAALRNTEAEFREKWRPKKIVHGYSVPS